MEGENKNRLPSWAAAPFAAPLADFPLEAVAVEVIFEPELTEFPLAAPAAETTFVGWLDGGEFNTTPFLVLAAFSAAVEFSLLFGETGKSVTSSLASLLSTRRFLLGGVAVVKDSALLDI